MTHKSFCFEKTWLEEYQFETIVTNSWVRDVDDDILAKLKNCMESINVWDKKLAIKVKFKDV